MARKASPNAQVREDRKRQLLRAYRRWQRDEADGPHEVLLALSAWIDGTPAWPLPPLDKD